MNRDFKGVWIPREIWLDKELSWKEKVLLVEIDSLSELGECFASNEYLASFIEVSKDRVSKLLSSLKIKGYIEIEIKYKEDSKEIEKRIITTIGYRRKQLGGIGENNYTPIGENNYDINIYNNKTIINTKDIIPLVAIEPLEQKILDQFNQICVSLTKASKLTEPRKKAINARLKNLKGDLDALYSVFERVEASDFLSGRKTDWRADFDWIMKPTNFIKIIEGKYDNRSQLDPFLSAMKGLEG